jgi:hypothetical protein
MVKDLDHPSRDSVMHDAAYVVDAVVVQIEDDVVDDFVLDVVAGVAGSEVFDDQDDHDDYDGSAGLVGIADVADVVEVVVEVDDIRDVA